MPKTPELKRHSDPPPLAYARCSSAAQDERSIAQQYERLMRNAPLLKNSRCADA